DCSGVDITRVEPLLGLAESYTVEVKLRCRGRVCGISGLDDVVPGKPFVYSGHLVVWGRVRGGYELKVGPKTARPPEPPLPASVFYVTSIEELHERNRVLGDLSRRIWCR
ncbi:MAG: hypothetical protein LRS47_01745, partial [Desulfurococcales archaeon]|nr:hypothetical protein [Desulfurococcales archaeon]